VRLGVLPDRTEARVGEQICDAPPRGETAAG
jgi:hypothetical protein